MTELELGWISGILEGEGSFFLCPHNGLRISVFMSDADVIAKLKALVCESTTTVHRKRKNPKWKDQFGIIVTGMVAARLMELVLPHMGIRRSCKIRDLLEKYYSNRRQSAGAMRIFYFRDDSLAKDLARATEIRWGKKQVNGPTLFDEREAE